MTQDVLQDAQVVPMIHVTIGEGDNAQIHDLTWGDVQQEGDDLTLMSDDELKMRVALTLMSDDELKMRVARWLDLDASVLSGHDVARPQTGNIVISAKAVFGE